MVSAKIENEIKLEEMDNTKQLKELKRIWNERNPQHDNNANTGEDMFWGTVLCVFNDLNKALPIEPVKVSDKEINDMLPLKPTDGTEQTVSFNTATLQARGGAKMLRDKFNLH